MAPVKLKCTYPECGASTKTKAEVEEHWEEFLFDEKYPGPLKATRPTPKSAPKSAKALKGGKGANKVGASSTTPIPALQSEATGQIELIATPASYSPDWNLISSNGVTMSGQALDNGSADVGERGKSQGGATKRKAASTPNTAAPPPKKKAPAKPAAQLQASKASSSAADKAVASTPSAAPKPLGARAIARLTEKAANDPSRDLQPIRRPLPPPEQEWSDSEPVPVDDESDEDEIIVPKPDIDVTTRRGYGDPFFNQDFSDSDMSAGISEDEDGVPRAYDPHAANSDPDHPYSKSAKYRILPPRGIVKNPDGTTIDFDSCMTFPDAPDPAILNRKAPQKVKGIDQHMAAPRNQVLMSFSENISTPEMNWTLRKNRAAASANAKAKAQAKGEFLDRGLGRSSVGLATTGDSIMINLAAKKAKEKIVALKKQAKKAKGLSAPKKKKKASRLPKYQKRQYTWKDSTRKNKGKLYDSRRDEAEAEAEEADGDD
ncbi:hypothetical protein IFR05_011606 [Cadophora sp. M221]|nr:hypothetical protein IFR05_011606 [Cadophora sp. M221]